MTIPPKYRRRIQPGRRCPVCDASGTVASPSSTRPPILFACLHSTTRTVRRQRAGNSGSRDAASREKRVNGVVDPPISSERQQRRDPQQNAPRADDGKAATRGERAARTTIPDRGAPRYGLRYERQLAVAASARVFPVPFPVRRPVPHLDARSGFNSGCRWTDYHAALLMLKLKLMINEQ